MSKKTFACSERFLHSNFDEMTQSEPFRSYLLNNTQSCCIDWHIYIEHFFPLPTGPCHASKPCSLVSNVLYEGLSSCIIYVYMLSLSQGLCPVLCKSSLTCVIMHRFSQEHPSSSCLPPPSNLNTLHHAVTSNLFIPPIRVFFCLIVLRRMSKLHKSQTDVCPPSGPREFDRCC